MRSSPLVLAAALAATVLAGCSSDDPALGPSPSPSSPAVTSSVPASPSPSALPTRSGPPKLALVARFDAPVHAASPPGDPRLFVVEQVGRIKIVKNGKVLARPFLDISAQVRHRGEQGLLSVAFAPDFATSKHFYVDYNGTDGAIRVAEFTVGADPDRADPATRRELLRIPKPHENHNGGQLAFDSKGMLVIATGDGGAGNDPDNRAQNLGDLLGKLLRIDPKPSGGRLYGIPADNPFAARSGARPEVWGYGLRNPWRFSFDAETGDLYVGDVGQYAIEELNAVPPATQPGANYGWRVYEGRRRNFRGETPNSAGTLVEPVHQFNHEGGKCVITGGVVYRGSVAALRGKFLFGEYCTGALWSVPAGTRANPSVTTLALKAAQVTSFGVDAAGEVYVISGNGEVWRIST